MKKTQYAIKIFAANKYEEILDFISDYEKYIKIIMRYEFISILLEVLLKNLTVLSGR